MRITTLAFVLLVTCPLMAQNYNGPESVEYDALYDRYLVSNTLSGQILARDQAGALTVFATSTPAPYGLEIKGDTVFACCSGRVKGFLLADGSPAFDLDLGGTFLNGITTDGTHLYATDFSAKKVYKVDPHAGTFEVLVDNTVQTPNGIVYDAVLDRLWLGCWGSSARIKSYDRVSGDELSSFTTALGNIDGITLDCHGDILVSSWSPARISRFEPTFTEAVQTVTQSGLSNPADIDFDLVHNRVCIPNSGNQTVTLFAYSGCSVSVEESAATTVALAPNPTDGTVRFLGNDLVGAPYRVFDASGAHLLSGRVPADGSVDLSSVAPGIYLVELPRAGWRTRVVRM